MSYDSLLYARFIVQKDIRILLQFATKDIIIFSLKQNIVICKCKNAGYRQLKNGNRLVCRNVLGFKE